MEITPSNFVTIEGTRVSVNATGLAEAKLALKELKLKKKEFGIQKKLIMTRQKEIRASYTDEVRTRGSMVRGGGGVGKFFRAIQTFSRDNKRAGLAADLAPLEKAKQEVEAMIHTLDHVILQVEAQLLRSEA
jgi:hypothetical protein